MFINAFSIVTFCTGSMNWKCTVRRVEWLFLKNIVKLFYYRNEKRIVNDKNVKYESAK